MLNMFPFSIFSGGPTLRVKVLSFVEQKTVRKSESDTSEQVRDKILKELEQDNLNSRNSIKNALPYKQGVSGLL